MSYQVLARKWRPRNFTEMVGQDHVLRALINALDQDRLHHAYLFTGTRGVGKTTVARILAKCLNCESGVSSEPCDQCGACKEIGEGRFVDLIEVDAASRTKVEDTRDLLDNVQYAPARGRYKVYLIDEVHMLSAHSFNALLKTLEEPPPHVKFLLATTNPQKLPATVLSRCLQFHLKRLPADLIVQYLRQILESEQVAAELPALHQLARAADGSMRDALSLLDQSIAYGGGEVKASDVRSMLGIIEQRHTFDIIAALAASDATGVLNKVAELAERTSEFSVVLEDLLSLLQQIAVAQALEDTTDDGLVDGKAVRQLANELSPEDVQLFYQIALTGRRDLPLAPDSRGGFEMILLRMLAFRPAEVDASQQRRRPTTKKTTKPAASQEKQPSPDVAPVVREGANEWGEVVESLQLKGMVRELACNCVLVGKNANKIELALDPAHTHLKRKNLEQRLEQALRSFYNSQVRLVVSSSNLSTETPAQNQARDEQERKEAAVQSIEEDSNVKAIQDMFNANISTDSIEPLNK